MINYEGHVVKKNDGWAKYRVICRDPYNLYVLQSLCSHDKLIRLPRTALELHWTVIDR